MSGAPSGLLTLLTDFGQCDAYVGAMKGVILSRAPTVQIVDISHEMGPQDVARASFVLAQAAPWYPPGTVHVAVVDPGVGTSRGALVAVLDDQWVVAPDNGIITHLYQQAQRRWCHDLSDPKLWLENPCATFHGRDLFAPTGALLASGQRTPRSCGPVVEPFLLPITAPTYADYEARGVVISVDHFGNLVTNLSGSRLPPPGPAVRVNIEEVDIRAFVRTYGEAPVATLVALIGSGGLLEVSRVEADAAKALDVGIGAVVTVQWT